MNEIYAAVTVAMAVFILVMCAFAPALQKSQEQEDAVRKLRRLKEKKNREKNRKRTDISERVKELKERQNRKLVSRNVRRRTAGTYSRRADRVSAKRLADANIRITLGTYSSVRIISGVILAAVNLLLGMKITDDILLLSGLVLSGLAAGMIVPEVIVRNRIKKRKKALLNSMPDTMDLLAVTTASGLGFDAAVMKISEVSASPCIQELRMVVNDVSHGVTKKEAYLAMQERSGIKEMTAFVTAIIQSDELGTPLSDVLSEQARVLREDRRLRAEEKANKAPVKITIPLVFCIFPALLIVLLGPAVLSLAKEFI